MFLSRDFRVTVVYYKDVHYCRLLTTFFVFSPFRKSIETSHSRPARTAFHLPAQQATPRGTPTRSRMPWILLW